jgi:hypothetical protein
MVRTLLKKAGAEENQPELAIKALESDQVERIAAVSPVVATPIETGSCDPKAGAVSLSERPSARGYNTCRAFRLPFLQGRVVPD